MKCRRSHFDVDIQRRSFLVSVDKQLMEKKNWRRVARISTHLYPSDIQLVAERRLGSIKASCESHQR